MRPNHNARATYKPIRYQFWSYNWSLASLHNWITMTRMWNCVYLDITFKVLICYKWWHCIITLNVCSQTFVRISSFSVNYDRAVSPFEILNNTFSLFFQILLTNCICYSLTTCNHVPTFSILLNTRNRNVIFEVTTNKEQASLIVPYSVSELKKKFVRMVAPVVHWIRAWNHNSLSRLTSLSNRREVLYIIGLHIAALAIKI